MPVVTAAAAPSTGGGTEDASATAVDVKATATNMDPRRWSVLSMHATKLGQSIYRERRRAARARVGRVRAGEAEPNLGAGATFERRSKRRSEVVWCRSTSHLLRDKLSFEVSFEIL